MTTKMSVVDPAVVTPPVRTYIFANKGKLSLEMNYLEAAALYALILKIAGDPESTPRGLLHGIYLSLDPLFSQVNELKVSPNTSEAPLLESIWVKTDLKDFINDVAFALKDR